MNTPRTISECEIWNEDKEWFYPLYIVEGMEYFGSDENYPLEDGRELDWLCDHSGDYSEAITRLWTEFKNIQSKLDKAVEALEEILWAVNKPRCLHSYHELNRKALSKAREALKEIIKEGEIDE